MIEPVKPVSVVAFAGDTNYPAGAEPEAGTVQKTDPAREDVGYRPNEHPTAQEFGWLMNLIGEWQQYLRPRVGRSHTFEFSRDADLSQHESGTGTATWTFNGGPDGTAGWKLFTTANNDEAGVYSGFLVDTPVNTKHIHILEWELDGTSLVGTPSIGMRMGFVHDEAIFASTNDIAGFTKSSASANWFANTCDGVTITSVDTGVAVAGIQKFAVFWYGATNSPSAAARVEFYIDDVLVHATGTTLPDANDIGFVAFQKSTGHTDDRTCKVSPVKYICCRYL